VQIRVLLPSGPRLLGGNVRPLSTVSNLSSHSLSCDVNVASLLRDSASRRNRPHALLSGYVVVLDVMSRLQDTEYVTSSRNYAKCCLMFQIPIKCLEKVMAESVLEIDACAL